MIFVPHETHQYRKKIGFISSSGTTECTLHPSHGEGPQLGGLGTGQGSVHYQEHSCAILPDQMLDYVAHHSEIGLRSPFRNRSTVPLVHKASLSDLNELLPRSLCVDCPLSGKTCTCQMILRTQDERQHAHSFLLSLLRNTHYMYTSIVQKMKVLCGWLCGCSQLVVSLNENGRLAIKNRWSRYPTRGCVS